jgi:predicted small lipoprotein YifL
VIGLKLFPLVRIMRTQLPCSIFIMLSMLSACGTKTPLTLPPGPAQPPLFGPTAQIQPATSPAAAKTADDNKPASGAVTP